MILSVTLDIFYIITPMHFQLLMPALQRESRSQSVLGWLKAKAFSEALNILYWKNIHVIWQIIGMWLEPVIQKIYLSTNHTNCKCSLKPRGLPSNSLVPNQHGWKTVSCLCLPLGKSLNLASLNFLVCKEKNWTASNVLPITLLDIGGHC